MKTDFKISKGQVQIYTGCGKGKTTASFGLAWRMLGYGANVYICQFLKPADIETGEAAMAQTLAENLPGKLTMVRADYDWNMSKSHDTEQRENAAAGITNAIINAKQILTEDNYDLVILDELIVCYSMKLVSLETIKEIIALRPSSTELVLTGRGADSEIIELADLVTEMKEIKHPFNIGIQARKGVEY